MIKHSAHNSVFQYTQASKTSEERWGSMLQEKLIHLLQHLKLLFEKESVICFSSLTQNKTKSMVIINFSFYYIFLTVETCIPYFYASSNH